nr:VOC family protein [Actinomycetota bacterium]
MSFIKSLGYIGFSGEDLDMWRSFGTDVLGLQVGISPEGEDTLYFRMDGRSFRLAVHKGPNGLLHYLGFEIGTREALAEFADHLRDQGLEVVEEGAELRAQRRVAAMQSTRDPSGNRIEFFVGHEEAATPFVSPTGASFVIEDMGIGHAFMLINGIDAFNDFYINKLGFRLSDTIGFAPGMTGHFLHCNPRHHTIAGADLPGMPPRLQHIMLQVSSIDVVGYAYDKAIADGIIIDSTLGRHTNDRMLSFYCSTPSGFSVEYGIDGRRVDDETWVVGHYTSASYWGHATQADKPI